MRKYPEPSDYQAAIQTPNLVLREPELRAATVKVDRLGLPVVSSGGFALSYGLLAPNGSQWVVRCFKADSPDRRARYDAISRFIDAHPDPILLDVDYAEEGILVNGAWYPIVKMPLVRGVTLQRYIEAELDVGRSVAHLSGKFRAVVAKLEQLGIAHGDLQHGNIMVQNGQLVLVDYDGMYVPALHGWPAAEMGSAAYQHPLRRQQFGPDLDRFSAIVIDMALQALAFAPGLWRKYDTGENLLFRQTDFTSPAASPLLHHLEQIPHLAPAVYKLRAICKGPFDAISRLDEVLPPLPAVVEPVNLPGITNTRRLFTWDAANLDEQLDQLYGNWKPLVAAEGNIPNPAPIPIAAGTMRGVPGLPFNVASGPITPPASAPPPPPKPPTPPTSPAQPKPAPGRADAPPKGLAVLRFVTSAVLFILYFTRSCASTFGPALPPRTVYLPTPPAETAYASVAARAAQPASPLRPGPCPTMLQVYPRDPTLAMYGDTVTLRWDADRRLPPNCSFQFKVIDEHGKPFALVRRPVVVATPYGYETDIHFPKDLPPAEQEGRFYSLELEVVDSQTGQHFGTELPQQWALAWMKQ